MYYPRGCVVMHTWGSRGAPSVALCFRGFGAFYPSSEDNGFDSVGFIFFGSIPYHHVVRRERIEEVGLGSWKGDIVGGVDTT